MDLLNAIRNLTVAVRDRKVGDILKYAGEIFALASELFQPVKAGGVECAHADLDAAVFDLETMAKGLASTAAAAEGDKANLDPASILLIVQAISAVISLFRKK